MQGVAPKQEHDEQEHDEQEHEPERAHEEPDQGGHPMPKPHPKPSLYKNRIEITVKISSIISQRLHPSCDNK